MMKRFLAACMALLLVAGVGLNVLPVAADSTEVKPYLSLGADLKESEKKTVYKLLEVDENHLDQYTLGEVTNAEEHEYLGEYLSKDVIGSRALSSVLVILEDDGEGISVETSNITYCTGGMYRNALATAGVKDATVKVAGPFNITGTAALVGAMKAYEEMTGENISSESKDAATNELVTTGEIAEILGDTEKAEQLIALVKDTVVSEGLTSKEDIMGAIEDACSQLEIKLSEEDRELILQLMEKISKLDIDIDQLKSQAEAVYNKLVEMGIDLKSEDFWLSVMNFFKNIIEAIIEFFKNIIEFFTT